MSWWTFAMMMTVFDKHLEDLDIAEGRDTPPMTSGSAGVQISQHCHAKRQKCTGVATHARGTFILRHIIVFLHDHSEGQTIKI